MATLQQLQLENEIHWELLQDIQTGTSKNPPLVEPHPSSAPSPTTCPSHPYVFEPTVNLPDKFNGMRAHLRMFINQFRPIIRL